MADLLQRHWPHMGDMGGQPRHNHLPGMGAGLTWEFSKRSPSAREGWKRQASKTFINMMNCRIRLGSKLPIFGTLQLGDILSIPTAGALLLPRMNGGNMFTIH